MYWKGNLKLNQKKKIISRADQESRKNLSLNHGNNYIYLFTLFFIS